MPGDITRNVPSRVTSARESNDEVARKPDAERREHRDEVLQDASGRRRRWCGRGRPSAGRARAPAARAATCSLTSATRSTPSRSSATSRRAMRDEHVDDRGLLDRVEPADRAEVDEPERAVAEDEHVPGMRVGVEEADRSTWSSIERSSSSASCRRSMLATAPSFAASATVKPFEALLDEEPAGAELAVDLRDPDVARRTDEHAPSPPSRRPRAGSRARRAGSARTGRASRPSARPGRSCVRRWATSASSDKRREVALHHVRDAGPLDLDDDGLARSAAARGRSDRSTPPRAAPSRTRRTPARRRRRARLRARARIRSTRLGRNPVLQLRELVADLGGQQVDARRRDLTELDVDAAGRLEHAPQPHAVGIVVRSLGAGVRDEERPEALASGEAHELAVAAERRSCAGCTRAQRARRDDETRALADRQRAGPGEQVERDRDGHRGGDPDRDDVEHEAVGAPVPVGQAQRQERRGPPADDARRAAR